VEQHELRPPKGAKRNRKRIGRGNASGQGTYAGKGMKGQQARAGSGPRIGFEGGQTPLIRRLPARRGFHNPFRTAYAAVNLDDLSRLPPGSEVTPETLREAGVVRSKLPVKLLGDGEVSAALVVKTHRVSSSARTKIEAAGGTVEELTPRKDPEQRRRRKHLREAEAKPAAAETEQPSAEDSKEEEEKDDSGTESSETASAE
jgi:large subunit ribosomal protein L15